jgi:ribonuclease D
MDGVWRIKGSHLLGRSALAVLRELWRWRETEATAANRPPFFVLSHESLFLPRNFSDRRRATLMKAVEQGLAVTPDKFPKLLQRINHRPSEAERKRFMELQKRRDAQAQQLAIDPTIIASRGTLSDLARNWDKYAAELMNWQRELLKPV